MHNMVLFVLLSDTNIAQIRSCLAVIIHLLTINNEPILEFFNKATEPTLCIFQNICVCQFYADFISGSYILDIFSGILSREMDFQIPNQINQINHQNKLITKIRRKPWCFESFFQIQDLDLRLGGCRTCVISGLFFKWQNWPLDTVKVWHLPQAIKKTAFAVSHYKSVYICWNILWLI